MLQPYEMNNYCIPSNMYRDGHFLKTFKLVISIQQIAFQMFRIAYILKVWKNCQVIPLIYTNTQTQTQTENYCYSHVGLFENYNVNFVYKLMDI